METTKQCLYCNKTIRGRSDKKFCKDYCRNYYNQRQKVKDGEAEKKINQILSKNKRVLQQISEEGNYVSVPKERLLSMGFDQRFCTEVHFTKSNTACFFCYEYGLLFSSGNLAIVFERAKHQAVNFSSP